MEPMRPERTGWRQKLFTSALAATALFVVGGSAVSCSGSNTDDDGGSDDNDGDGTPTNGEAETRVVEGSPTIIVHSFLSGADMQVGGTLAYLPEDDCLVVVRTIGIDGVSQATPIWPDGVQPVVRDGRHGVEVPGFGPILDGDDITAGGDYAEDPPTLETEGLPPGCLSEGWFVFFNHDSFS